MHFISKIFTSIELFRRAFHEYKRSIIYLILLGFFSGILGGVGISAIVPLFSFISNGNGATINNPVSGIFEKVFNSIGIQLSLPAVIVALILLFLFKAGFLYIANIINAKVVLDFETKTRSQLFGYTMKANWPYLIDQKIGYLSQIIIEDVNASASLLMNISLAILAVTSLTAYAIIAIGISPKITMVTILMGIVTFFILKPLFYKIRKLSKGVVAISKELSHYINQHLIGAKTVKSMVIEDGVLNGGGVYFKEFSELKLKLAKCNNILGSFLEPLTLFVIIPVFLVSYKDSNFNIASFAAILYLIQKMFSFVQNIQIRFSVINQGIPSLLSVVNYQTESKKHIDKSTGKIEFKFDSVLKFENVGFNYKDEKSSVLSNLNFVINRGESVGLIGHSGSGKTTIADLIMRLFNPSTGRITADGVDISEINLEKWRRDIGYVSQDIFLLNDTIANNIRFYGDDISDENILGAAKLANIYDFIMQQPNKFNTFVGERGLKLSVGQRQRIILARIIARNPKVLILDEATSALDNESEVSIRRALEELRGKMTIFMIAHRLSTLVNADKIIVLDKGQIIEDGSPKMLLENKNSYFYKMHHIID